MLSMLLAFRSPSPFAGGKDLPTRLLVGKWGRNVTGGGEGFTVNETTAATLPRLQQALSWDTVALDFQHNTVSKDGRPIAEPVKVAAHGQPRVIPGEGLFLEELRWTPEGKDAALGGHYPDLSPAVKLNDRGEVIAMHSAALCRQGSVMDLQLFSAALSSEQLRLFQSPSTAPSMDFKKLCLMILGLAETATDTEIESGAKAFAAKMESAGKVATFAAQFEKLDLAGLATFSAELKKISDAGAALEKRIQAFERRNLIADAVAQGKVVPFGAEFDSLTNEQFGAILAKLPADQVPLTQRTPEGLKTFGAAAARAAGPESDVRKLLNIPEEVWKKHNPAA